MTKRELAFCYIYSQEIQGQNSRNQVKLFLDSTEVEDGKSREYVKEIAKGIKENNEEITNIIAENLKTGWTIDRLSKVDLSLLKLAIYEINYKKVPFKIIINRIGIILLERLPHSSRSKRRREDVQKRTI